MQTLDVIDFQGTLVLHITPDKVSSLSERNRRCNWCRIIIVRIIPMINYFCLPVFTFVNPFRNSANLTFYSKVMSTSFVIILHSVALRNINRIIFCLRKRKTKTKPSSRIHIIIFIDNRITLKCHTERFSTCTRNDFFGDFRRIMNSITIYIYSFNGVIVIVYKPVCFQFRQVIVIIEIINKLKFTFSNIDNFCSFLNRNRLEQCIIRNSICYRLEFLIPTDKFIRVLRCRRFRRTIIPRVESGNFTRSIGVSIYSNAISNKPYSIFIDSLIFRAALYSMQFRIPTNKFKSITIRFLIQIINL